MESKLIKEGLGTAYLAIIQLLFLGYKHDNDCTLTPSVDVMFNMIKGKKRKILMSDVMITWNADVEEFETNFEFHPDSCNNKRFVLIPMALRQYSNVLGSIFTGHSNFLLLNLKNGELERFDPNGYTTPEYKPESLDKHIQSDLISILSTTLSPKVQIKYITPSDFCPYLKTLKTNIGPQYLQGIENTKKNIVTNREHCSLWSIFYANARLSNPEISRKDLVLRIISKLRKSDDTFTHFILSFGQSFVFISENIKDINSLKELYQLFDKIPNKK